MSLALAAVSALGCAPALSAEGRACERGCLRQIYLPCFCSSKRIPQFEGIGSHFLHNGNSGERRHNLFNYISFLDLPRALGERLIQLSLSYMKSHYLWLFSKHIDVSKLKPRGIPGDIHEDSSALSAQLCNRLGILSSPCHSGGSGESCVEHIKTERHCGPTRPPPAFRLSQIGCTGSWQL